MRSNNAHESFLVYRGLKFFWLAVALVFVAIVLYIWHEALGGPNGGAWLGFTLGVISVVLVIWFNEIIDSCIFIPPPVATTNNG